MRISLSFLLSSGWIRLMRWLYGLLLCVIIILSLIPAKDDIPGTAYVLEWLATVFLGDPVYSDKVSHFLAYGVMTGVGMLGFIRPLGRYLLLPLLMLALSGVLELAQGLVSFRTVEWLDFAANAAGVLAGTFVAGMLIFLAQLSRQQAGAAA